PRGGTRPHQLYRRPALAEDREAGGRRAAADHQPTPHPRRAPCEEAATEAVSADETPPRRVAASPAEPITWQLIFAAFGRAVLWVAVFRVSSVSLHVILER